jgi:hypothetical protein
MLVCFEIFCRVMGEKKEFQNNGATFIIRGGLLYIIFVSCVGLCNFFCSGIVVGS